MSKKSNFLKSPVLPIIFLVVSVISAILFRAARSNWVFINLTLGIEAFTVILLSLMVLTAVLFTVLSALRIYEDKKSDDAFYQKKTYNVLLLAGIVLSVIFGVFAIIYSSGLAFGENSEVFTLNLKKSLSEGAFLIIVPFFAIFYPALGCKVKKAVLALAIIVTALLGINSFSPLSPYKITSTPMIIDNGSGYSVVFSTNDAGSAWIEYTFEGKDFKVFDQTGGRISSERRIHNISVPYEHLRNNTYKVGSTRIIEDFSYGSRTGKTVFSDEFTLTFNDKENQTWLVISDWHTMLNKAYSAIDNLKSEYDAVILLGDSTPGVDFEEQVITNTVQFGGEVSGGTRPILYVRGNHETRGSYADELPAALGLEQFYYTADIGPYSFVVLDSGEDKDDSHPEYGGLTDYNTYRADMIEWLKGTEVKNDKVIALSHSWRISDVEKELSVNGWSELTRLNTRLLLSGHEHKCRFIGENEDEKEYIEANPKITAYIDGGKVGDGYIASLLTLDGDGFEIRAVDNKGDEVIKEKFIW